MRSAKYTRESVQSAVSNSKSVSETMKNLGLAAGGGRPRTILKNYIKEYGIDTSHFERTKVSDLTSIIYRKKPEDVLVLRTSDYRESGLKLKRALFESGISEICNECKIGPMWNSVPLTLEVDHINGDWKDCRIGNLRLLCPNCHSQQRNFEHKRKRKIPKEKPFKQKISRAIKDQPGFPTDEELKQLLYQFPVIKLAPMLGCAQNTFNRILRQKGIETPGKGYWTKYQKNIFGREPRIINNNQQI